MDMHKFQRFLSIKKPAPFPEQENQKKTTNKRMVLRDLIYSYEPLTLGEPFSLGYRIRFLQLLFHWRRDINFIIARISRVPMCEVPDRVRIL